MMILHMVANIFLEQIILLLFLPCNKAQSLNTYNQRGITQCLLYKRGALDMTVLGTLI